MHGKLERLHIDPTAIVNNALFNVSGGEITIGAYAFGHVLADVAPYTVVAGRPAKVIKKIGVADHAASVDPQ